MRVFVTNGDGAVRTADAPAPETGDYDCLVKIISCLFCNSTDRHIVERTMDLGITYPCVLGHESVGKVVSCGRKVKNFKPGDHVVRPYAMYPDESLGGLGSGWGGFAEFGKIRDFRAMTDDGAMDKNAVPGFFKYMRRLPDGLDPEKAMMISCASEILSSARQIPEPAGKSFLVAGAGAAGCLFALWLKKAGAGKVTVTARRREQLDFALRNTPADSAELMDSLPRAGRVFDALVDTTGSAAAVDRALDTAVKEEGAFYSYAIYPEMADKNFFERYKKRVKFQRVDPIEAETQEAVCGMLLGGEIDFSAYITRKFTADSAEEAWGTVRDKNSVKTAVLF
jgi:L-iditol 2-dehydrogenase